ncbi:MAG TPA: CHAT domain-containing protein [Pyrinomonadaceae bacterium]|nr:CHAT domain-containing protein [Pyrinomonadaceae bacterium]
MGFSLKSEETIREYLLGRVSDETQLEGIEELLFTDEDFCSQVELMEDSLINDYVLGRLDEADVESFRSSLAGNPERSFKLELTQALREKALARKVVAGSERPSFLTSINAFFRQPKYVGVAAVLLIAIVGFAVYLTRRSNTDEIAELRSIYGQSRPTETRIAEFGYAPLAQLRGAPEPQEQIRLRRIENSLIDARGKSPNADTHHALGVFYLTQQNYTLAIKELESALKFTDQNAQIYNDLGAAHFELSKADSHGRNREYLAQSLEDFTKATELDGNLLEALFNKSLALQELGSARKAKESWNLYLQRDPSSPWANEARKNLARIESEQARQKTDKQVLDDFLTAYRNQDNARVQKIHNETKGLLKGPTVPLQLARRYLVARQHGNNTDAKESLAALTLIGDFEQAQNDDSFFFELANFYSNLNADQVAGLLQAQDILAAGHLLIKTATRAISHFERSRDLFARLGDECEAGVADIWAVQFLYDIGKVAEIRLRLTAIIDYAQKRKFNVLLPPAYYWLGMADYQEGRFSESARHIKTALQLAEARENTFEIQHAQHALAVNYSELGELEPALFYSGKLLTDKNLYYQNLRQDWRAMGVLVDIFLKWKFFASALALSQERLDIARENWPTDSLVNDSLRNLIEAATAKEDFPAALKYAGQSMQLVIERGATAENTRKKAELYRLLADLKRRSKTCNEALTDYDQALDLFRRSPEVTESLYQVHKGKLFCFQQLNRPEDFSSELKTVFNLSEEYRAKIREDESRQAFFASDQDVFDAATANAIMARDSREAFAFVETSKARSLLDFVESGKSIVEAEKSFGPVAQPLETTEIQARLPDQVEIVQYAVLPDKLAIWVISKTRFDLHEVEITATDLEKKVVAYQTLIAGKGPSAEIKEAAQHLYGLLIPPDLSADKQLCLVPDKSLHQLAFATLVSPYGKYLLQDYALFYAPSASVLVLATENARSKDQFRNESLLSVGNPAFDREENLNLPDLRDAEAEAKAIAADYQKSLELLGSEATKEKFLRNLAGAEVIHFAGHYVANQQSPGNSKLLFAGGELRSSELSAYKLPLAKLVVLSACETGVERYNKSEGAIGIARTLLALGAPLVVGSQWKVDSEPTKDLMIAFHRNRKEKNMTTAESLRQAQLEVLSREQTSAPFYWAAFSLFGGYANY